MAINNEDARYLCFWPSFISAAIQLFSNEYLLLLEHANIMRINKPITGEKNIFPYRSYGPPKMAVKTQNSLYLCFWLSFSFGAIKLCWNAFLLLLDHNNVMGIQKPMPGEKGIFPYSSYGPPKRAMKTQRRWKMVKDSPKQKIMTF